MIQVKVIATMYFEFDDEDEDEDTGQLPVLPACLANGSADVFRAIKPTNIAKYLECTYLGGEAMVAAISAKDFRKQLQRLYPSSD